MTLTIHIVTYGGHICCPAAPKVDVLHPEVVGGLAEGHRGNVGYAGAQSDEIPDVKLHGKS